MMLSKDVTKSGDSVVEMTTASGNGGESTSQSHTPTVTQTKSIANSSPTPVGTKREMPGMTSPSATTNTNNTKHLKYETKYLNHLNQSHRRNLTGNANPTLGDKSSEFAFKVPPEAPIFRPTEDEFQNPLAYISKIRPCAEKFGICKIVPPISWQPPFTVDVDKLRFTPRVQRLNELEAKTRIKLNFLDQIAKFWELQGSSLKIPMVERKALDLYTLHRIVQEEGGLEATTKDRKWSRIACRLGYPQGKSVGTILKGHYERILYPFDIYASGKVIDSKLEGEQSDDCDYKPHCIISRQAVTPPTETTARRSKRLQVPENKTNTAVSPPSNNFKHSTTKALPVQSGTLYDQTEADDVKPSTSESSKIKMEVADLEISTKLNNSEMNSTELDQPANNDDGNAELRRLQIHGAGPKMAGVKMGNFNIKMNENPKSRMNCGSPFASPSFSRNEKKTSNVLSIDPLAKYICHTCNRGDVEEAMLLCDGCDDSYHTFCLMPPLLDIPKGEWRCPKCVVEEVHKPVEAFGFEQAQREYTLQQFGEMADHFKADYFQMPVHLVPSELVEKEYWRIVSSIDEDVTVEYGADLHTMDHGSGFPTKSSLYLLPADREYAESNWNLNNLPVLEESVLGHINADISGMKVPWMYVGMCFATFCWHNEDHWSYSINYLHWGEPKTWYGVPGGLADKFEATMKSVAPELFHSQPDLLHQLVTIMNPNTLMNASVPVYRTDQHAGEFIVTFPRAYHAGFNQGYNFAEAVNFATADWMKIGRECVNHYSKLRRFCVFSHDELVCKMALEPDRLNLGIATACYIDMAEMVEREKGLRKTLLEWGVTKAEREAFELLPDDARQCEICKTTCFLSAVTCECKMKSSHSSIRSSSPLAPKTTTSLPSTPKAILSSSSLETPPTALTLTPTPDTQLTQIKTEHSATPAKPQLSNISDPPIDIDESTSEESVNENENNNEQLACLRHYTELCDKCRPNQHILKYRYTLDELPLMIRKLKVKAEAVEKWLSKVKKVFDPKQPTTITLEELQEITQEALVKKFPNSLLLERLQSAVLEAEKCVTVIQQLNINKIRPRTTNANTSNELADYKLTLDELDLFVQEIDNLYCVINEGESVRDLKRMGTEFVQQATRMLNERLTIINEKDLEQIIEVGVSLCIELPQIAILRARLEQIQWLSRSKQLRGKNTSNSSIVIVGDTSDEAFTMKITLNQLQKLYEDGSKIQPHSVIDKELAEIHYNINVAQEWEIQAKSILNLNSSVQKNNSSKISKDKNDIEKEQDCDNENNDYNSNSKNGNDNANKSSFNNTKKPIFTHRPNQLIEIHDLLHRSATIPVVLPTEGTLREIIKQIKEWHRMVEILQKNENYPYFKTLENIVAMGKRIPIQLDDIGRMEEHIALANEWKNRTSTIFLKKDSPYKLMEVLTIRTIKNMENRKIDDKQKSLFGDDVGSAQMVNQFKIDSESAIMNLKSIRQRNSAKSTKTQTFCICKEKYSGLMLSCNLCKDCFHLHCIPPITTSSKSTNKIIQNYIEKVKEGKNPLLSMPELVKFDLNKEIKYLCPDCMRSRRPRLETILELLVSLQRIPVRVPEGEALQCLTERAMSWQDSVKHALEEDEVATSLEKFRSIIMAQRLVKQKENNKESKNYYKNDSMNKNNTIAIIPGFEETDNSTDNEIHCNDDNVANVQFEFTTNQNRTTIPNSSSHNSIHPSSDQSLINLSETAKENLETLMIEGELLEVSLSETQDLWRILAAANPQVSSIDYSNNNYNILPTNDGLVIPNNKKRKIVENTTSVENNLTSTENTTTILSQSNAKLSKNNHIPTKRGCNRKQVLTTISAISPSTISNSVLQNNYSINNTENEKCGDDNDDEQDSAIKDSAIKIQKPNRKVKRGRKMKTKVTTNNFEEGNPLKTNPNKKCKKVVEDTELQGTEILSQGKKKIRIMKTKSREQQKNDQQKVNNENVGDESIDDEISNPSNGDEIIDVHEIEMETKISIIENDDENDIDDDENDIDDEVDPYEAYLDDEDDEEEEEDECGAINCARPMGTEVDWVQCDGGCNIWFHMFCVGIIKSQIKPDDDYVCKKCRGLQTKSNKQTKTKSSTTNIIISTSTNNNNNTNTSNITKESVIPIGTKKRLTKPQSNRHSKKGS